jgi:hypothetical protein
VDASECERPGGEMVRLPAGFSPPGGHSASKTRVNALTAATLPSRGGMAPPVSLAIQIQSEVALTRKSPGNWPGLDRRGMLAKGYAKNATLP